MRVCEWAHVRAGTRIRTVISRGGSEPCAAQFGRYPGGALASFHKRSEWEVAMRLPKNLQFRGPVALLKATNNSNNNNNNHVEYIFAVIVCLHKQTRIKKRLSQGNNMLGVRSRFWRKV